MSFISRLLIIISALSLSLTYFLPLWTIALDAPQYPEGLGIEVWINQIEGQHPNDLVKINNLNHYIGMKKIVPESIPELKIMPWVMRTVLLFGLAVGFLGKRKLLLIWLMFFMLVAIVGFVDYYQWGYDYGHNLDLEHAIIKVPGMSYQPPLIGSRKLLNFTAVSLPGAGGWVAIGAFLTGFILWINEIRRHRKETAHE